MNSSISQITQIWDKALLAIKSKLNEPNIYDYFFSNSYINEISNDSITVVANSKLATELMSTKYYDLISKIINEITETNFKLLFVNAEEVKKRKKEQELLDKKKEDSYFDSPEINKDLRFDNFVIGDFNREASQAALLIAANPGKMFNPLYIYSNSGLGKTHLLHAIGNHVKEIGKPGSKILYITANDFVEKYIKFVRGEKEAESIKDYISSHDVLLLDDVQFLENKPKTQEIFFYVYQKLINSGKQIVITSDKQPSELKSIEERLVSRFSQGLLVKIDEPDHATCIEILKKKIIANNLNLEDFENGVIEFYAKKFSKNVRELEGALNRLIFYAITFKQSKNITMNLASEAVSSLAGSKNIAKEIDEQRIINIVADYYNMTPSQLTGKIRTGQIALARHIAMYLIRSMLDISLKKIGEIFGGKDHTTVMSAITKVEKGLKTDELLKKAVDDLKHQLKP